MVDDNINAAAMTALILEQFGHEVRVAHSAAGALDTLRHYRASVAILDIGLPTWMATRWPPPSAVRARRRGWCAHRLRPRNRYDRAPGRVRPHLTKPALAGQPRSGGGG